MCQREGCIFRSLREPWLLSLHFQLVKHSKNIVKHEIIGCSKYTAITASDVTETTHSLIENHSHSQVDKILFNQTFLINHDGSRNFAAKIIFSEKDTRGGNRYEIGKYSYRHFHTSHTATSMEVEMTEYQKSFIFVPKKRTRLQ